MYNGKSYRLGLCCIFREADIRFRSRQAGTLLKLQRNEQLDRLSTTILHNSSSLVQALSYCAEHGIGSFRVNSGFLPMKSHPRLGYGLDELPDMQLIFELLATAKHFAREHNLRLTFHPDQFTLLSSPRAEVTRQSLAELAYHAELAEYIGADVIILHGGGAYGDKEAALGRLAERLVSLPVSIRSRLVLENDDRIFTPGDLLPLCEKLAVPLAYDVHHHRCLSDGLSVEEVTGRAMATWNREPLFHLSSPREGWQGRDPRPHHDYIDPADFPPCWLGLELTVEIEAKAKELAVRRLLDQLLRMGRPTRHRSPVRLVA